MSLVTHSTKRNREYPRAFDHEEAQALRAAGESYTQIADRYGVSYAAVHRVCDPATRKKMDKAALAWMHANKREVCKGGCGELVWTNAKGRTGYCPACWGMQRVGADVRDGELRCTKCREWKPDGEFSAAKSKARRGRRPWCRSCDTAVRRAHRAASREQERTTDNRRKRRGKPMGQYVVLRKTGEKKWELHDNVYAPTRMAAIEKAAGGEGTFAAVTEAQMREFVVEPITAFRVARNGDSAETTEPDAV